MPNENEALEWIGAAQVYATLSAAASRNFATLYDVNIDRAIEEQSRSQLFEIYAINCLAMAGRKSPQQA